MRSFSHDEIHAPLRSRCERIQGVANFCQRLLTRGLFLFLPLHRHCGGYGDHPP
jgi:hypothetical protein